MISSHGSLKVRDPLWIAHTISDIIRARAFAICRRCKQADDLDVSRSVRAFQRACGRLPDSGRRPCTEPALSRLANALSLTFIARPTWSMLSATEDEARLEGQRN
jgi:hypothetical protein